MSGEFVYCISNWQKIRKSILRRDYSTCRICSGIDDLEVHHIDRDRRNNDPENLVTLCTDCHFSVHSEGYVLSLFPDIPVPWGVHPSFCEHYDSPIITRVKRGNRSIKRRKHKKTIFTVPLENVSIPYQELADYKRLVRDGMRNARIHQTTN